MDYGYVLRRAWETTWRWKVLWIFGFLAGLARATSGGNPSYAFDGSDFGGATGFEIPPEVAGVAACVGCLAVIVAIAIWVVSVIARGALIAGVDQVEEDGTTGFGEAWRAGAKHFWRLLGISLLVAIPMIILIIILALTTGVAVFGALSAESDGGLAAAIGSAVVCGGAFCCVLFILAIVLGQIRVYAERAAILDDMSWTDAVKQGWTVLKENLGPTAVLWIIFFFIGMALAMLIFAIFMATFIPFVALITNVDTGAWIAATVCCGGIFAVIVGALFSAIVETFSSATWTLTYRELTGKAQYTSPAEGSLGSPVAPQVEEMPDAPDALPDEDELDAPSAES